jgi:hypothetical protein
MLDDLDYLENPIATAWELPQGDSGAISLY